MSAPPPRIEGRQAGVDGGASQGLFYAEELVVLRHALAAGRRAGLDLARVHGHGEVGDRRVLGLAAAVADHRRVTCLVRELHRLEGLRERADLVDLYEDGVPDAIAYSAGEYLRVGYEEVVADELDPVSQLPCDHTPPIPVVFGQTVLDAQDGILVAQPHVVVHHLLPGELLTLAGEVVLTVLVELGGGRVEREGYLVPQGVSAPLDSLRDEPERGAVALEVWREATLVADATGETPLGKKLLEHLVDQRDRVERLGVGVETYGHDHELLEIYVVGRVGAAVQGVGARDREGVSSDPAKVTIQWERDGFRRGLRRRQRDTEDRVGPEATLVLGAVGFDHGKVEGPLVGGVQHALAAVALPLPITQFDGLVLAGRGSRGDRGPANETAHRGQLHLDRRIPPGVQDLTPVDSDDLCHYPPFGRKLVSISASQHFSLPASYHSPLFWRLPIS